MDERDWKDEQRSVLIRLFDSAFSRGKASDEVIEADIHRMAAASRNILVVKLTRAILDSKSVTPRVRRVGIEKLFASVGMQYGP